MKDLVDDKKVNTNLGVIDQDNNQILDAIPFLQPKGIENISDLGLDFLSSIAEFIDNSIEAKSNKILVVLKNNVQSVDMIIIENGIGMDKKTLQYAMTFGGEDGAIKKKEFRDVGKFHAGITIGCMALTERSEIYSNNGEGWVKNYIDQKEIKLTRNISPSKECELPEEVKILLEDLKKSNKFDIDLKTGTIIQLKDIKDEMISNKDLNLEANKLYDNLCIRYHNYLSEENDIYIMVNNTNNIKKCRSIHPLLKDPILLEESKLDIVANFKYENILYIKEVLPSSRIDAGMDIEFVILKKHKKSDKMKNAENLVKINETNQGYYIDRNGMNIVRAKNVSGGVKHPSTNNIRAYSDLDGHWDTVLGINLNKSGYSINSRFYELLNERLKGVYTHLKKVNREEIEFNPPSINIKLSNKVCEPIIIKDLMHKNKDSDGENTTINTGGEDEDDNVGKPPINTGGEDEDDNVGKPPINTGGQDEDDNSTYGNSGYPIKKERVSRIEFNRRLPLIFAAKNKPICQIGFDGILDIYNGTGYQIYDKEISDLGIRKKDMQKWCKEHKMSEEKFYEILISSIPDTAPCQKEFFEYYMKNIYYKYDNAFFLFPEVYAIINTMSGQKNSKQRVDFLLAVNSSKKIVIEIDGVGHQAEKDKSNEWKISPRQYEIDNEFDRRLKLMGCEVYRIGNYAIKYQDKSKIKEFIEDLLDKYKL